MNKALKRFKRVKWIDTKLSRKYKARKALSPFYAVAITAMAQQEIDMIIQCDASKNDKVIAYLNVAQRTMEAISKII